MLEQKDDISFTILPKSPVLPKSFKILPRSDNEIIPTSTNSKDHQYIKEAHQSFVVLGKIKDSDVDTIEEILDEDDTTSSKDTIRLSDDDTKDDPKFIRRPYRLVPLRRPANLTASVTGRWFTSKNNWLPHHSQEKKVLKSILFCLIIKKDLLISEYHIKTQTSKFILQT